ncbi:MAG: transglutaminase domain-containing protein, partial [Planctomycetes bacterium]|nr:transglutaminase domain-containing protein [Planctomycetota bacterium]
SLGLDALPSPLGESWKPRPRSEPPRTTRRAESRDPLERRALEGIFPDEVRYGDDAVDFTGRPVMEVRVARNGVALGPEAGSLYLRGLALDRVGETRVQASVDRVRRVADEDDGVRDGWVRFPSAKDDPTLDLVVRQRPMRIGVKGSIALFAPAPLLAVEAPAVLHSPDVMTTLPEAPDDWFELRLQSYDWSARDHEFERRSAKHPDESTRRLPRDSAELREIAAVAARVCAGATNDYERVLAVREHFAAYDYELITRDLPGVQGVVALFDRGSGHCTHFASATVLMLRCQGVSARIATGYLANTYDPELGGWLVSSRNGHAWVEVWFEGVGWVPFETTPMTRRARALDWTADGGGLTAWAADLATDVELWAGSGGEARYLKLAFQTALDFPEAAWASSKRRPLVVAILLACAIAALLWRRRDRRVRERFEQRVAPAVQSSRKLEQRWLADLAARGHRRAPHQTWREFVAAVATVDAALADRLRPVATAFERVAYAGKPLDAAERNALEAQLSALRAS